MDYCEFDVRTIGKACR